MASPVNGITSMTYDGSWITLARTNIKISNVDGLAPTQIVGFPTTAFSPEDPTLGNQRQYQLAENLNNPSNPPFGLIVNNTEKPEGTLAGLYESFADYDVATNTATLRNGFSFSNFTLSAQDVSSFTLIYQELELQSDPSESTNTLQQLNNQIHVIRNQSEMTSKLDNLKSQIKTALDAGASVSYYQNHTGRELFRKLNNFGLNHLIPTSHDSGFRPDDTNLD